MYFAGKDKKKSLKCRTNMSTKYVWRGDRKVSVLGMKRVSILSNSKNAMMSIEGIDGERENLWDLK